MNTILITGGTGFIGSHCCIELINDGSFHVLVLDNYANSNRECINRMEKITNKKIDCLQVDICDKEALNSVFKTTKIDAVLHLAALKAITESIENPIDYYKVNFLGTLNLIECMKENDVKNLVFSSSACVYGVPKYLPLDEKHPCEASQIPSPYGKTKYMCEQMLNDLYRSDASWNIIVLRYFNPVGAHESGLIGENPVGVPQHLAPFISQVAVGKYPEVKIFGNDYETPDGTGVRDYIHIKDLSIGHCKALQKLLKERPGLKVYNLGTGRGYSVLELIRTFERVCGKPIPCRVVERRPGDVVQFYSDPTLAERELDWKAIRGLEEMCKDLWNWQIKNPTGF